MECQGTMKKTTKMTTKTMMTMTTMTTMTTTTCQPVITSKELLALTQAESEIGLFGRVLRDSTSRYVSLSVGRSVGRLVGPLLGSGPKGSMTYAFTQMGNLLLLLLCTPPPPASRAISQPRGPYPSLKAQIPLLRPKSQPRGPNSSLKGFGP